jgi:hypothetical protein
MQELFKASQPEQKQKSKTIAIVVGSLALAAIPLSLALFLGTWGFEYRGLSLHQGRLERLVQRQPKLEQVMAGLEAEGSALLAAPSDQAALAAAAVRWGREHAPALQKKASEHAQTRVFRAGDFIYFLYFDADDVLRDFAVIPLGSSEPG